MDTLRNELANYIPWIIAFHIIAVIAWMSAMLYLPRLFVYHTETAPGSEGSERFKVMERRLLKGIMNPSMIAVWILGPLLAWLTGAYLDTWLQRSAHSRRRRRSPQRARDAARRCRSPAVRSLRGTQRLQA